MYLLDTPVITELRKARSTGDQAREDEILVLLQRLAAARVGGPQ